MTKFNTNLILICGESGTGKTTSLRDLPDPKNVIYLNCEAGKKPSFPAKFKSYTITDPYQVYEAFDKAETIPAVHTIIVDSSTFLMDMFESVHVIGANNTMQQWQAYAQFFKNLMQQYVAKSTKNVIFTAHTLSIMNDADMVLSRQVPIKGALKGVGVESFFSLVIACKTIETSKLKDHVPNNKLLTITPEEEQLGMKYVYQTRLTKETVHDRIRSPIGMFDLNETFTDNNVVGIIKRLQQYYKV